MRILNFGSLNLDYIYDVNHFVQAGETLTSTGMEVFCGGKGFNQSLAVRKSGQEVWHAGAIGENDASSLIESLLMYDVHINLITKKEGSSGHAIIQKNEKGQNCILLYGGANQKITREDVDSILKQFGEGDYLLLQNEISEVGYIMEEAHKKGMKIVFNPSPMTEDINDYPLENIDYLILNEIEAKQIYEMKQPSDETSTQSVEEKMAWLKEYLPKAKIMLTLGDVGSIYMDGNRKIIQKAYPVQAIDTTGAGDTFTGYLVGSLAQGKTIEEAMDRAAKAAAISVTRKGAGPSIPTLEEVLEAEF